MSVVGVNSEIKPQTIVTWAKEEEYKYEWKIEKFRSSVKKHRAHLRVQKLMIETKKDSLMPTKWVVGLKASNSFNVHVTCQLVDILGDFWNADTEIHARFSARFKDNQGRLCGDRNECETKGAKKLNEYFEELLMSGNFWRDPLDRDYRDSLFDAFGVATLEVQLNVLQSYATSSAEILKNQHLTQSIPVAKIKMAHLLCSESVGFDTKIICSDGVAMKCHQSILKDSSPVFKTMLESEFAEAKTGIINVSDISGKAMETLLHYMYTGRLQKTWNDPEVILDLTYAAGKYDMRMLLEFLDDMIGIMDSFKGINLFALKTLAGHLSLKKAEVNLKENIGKEALHAETFQNISAVFENDD